MKKISVYFKNPRRALNGVMLDTCRLWPDKLYLSTLYRLRFRSKLNWKNPMTFCEKMNWLKIYDRNPIYTTMADKYAVKKYVADRIGGEYIVENYAVYDRWEDIDFSKLPDQFVVKCTHDSGGAFVCRSQSTFDFDEVRRQVENNLKVNYFYHLREWPYKNIKPRIVIDRFLDDHTGNELRDYKFWCFNGTPIYMYCTIKAQNIFENFYDMDFQPVMIDHSFPRHQPEFERPANFDLMKDLASKLSHNVPFVRVDFFDVDNRIFFGEFTFYDWGGMLPFGKDWDVRLGKLIALPQKDQ